MKKCFRHGTFSVLKQKSTHPIEHVYQEKLWFKDNRGPKWYLQRHWLLFGSEHEQKHQFALNVVVYFKGGVSRDQGSLICLMFCILNLRGCCCLCRIPRRVISCHGGRHHIGKAGRLTPFILKFKAIFSLNVPLLI